LAFPPRYPLGIPHYTCLKPNSWSFPWISFSGGVLISINNGSIFLGAEDLPWCFPWLVSCTQSQPVPHQISSAVLSKYTQI
jgi:hypothetical protein